MFEDRNYLVFNMSEIDVIDFEQVLETSEQSLRKNNDGTKSFIKWASEIPLFVDNLEFKEGPYTYIEIKEILNSEEWMPIMDVEIPFEIDEFE